MSEDEILSVEQDNRPGVLDPVETAPPPSGPAAGASAADRARAALDAIEADARSARPTHPANLASHPRHLIALEEKLNLRRVLLGNQNAVRDIYFEPGETGVLPDVPTETLTITREDLPKLAPGDWTRAQTERVVTAADTLGVSPYETVRLFNLVAQSAPPPAERELDLDALWGDAADENIRLVNGLLTKIRTHDEELHDRLLPFVQRHPGVAEHFLAVARRLAGHAPRSAPARPTPAAEPVDREASRWPFVWSDEQRR